MPETFEIDPERELVTSRAFGSLSNEDMRMHCEQLVAHPAFRPTYRQLADLRDVTEFIVDSQTIEEVARMRVFEPGTRRAIVAATGVGFGLARMYSMYSAATGQVLEVFTDLHDAEDWLGL
jgi:hypothetical protein